METKTQNVLGELNLDELYKKYMNVLKDAKVGEVVTRFPPEPSGYLHIGHVKASMINFHYSRIYKGKMICRFDDTNPTKEKDEYVQSILEDLKTLGIQYDRLTNTSDYFETLLEWQTKLIKEGKCYCDNTPVEQMRKERFDGIESKCRGQTVEENLKIWEKMQKGEAKDYCVRGKANMQNPNKCMRDPVFYRGSDEEHHRTGKKYKVYPTYDFACPIVDSIEGVSHTMRTNEYSDRIEQYYWVLDLTGLRKPTIYEFSRLNFVRTVLSKRKLQWFVDSKRVEGWDDPRFPTVRGIIRRGLQIETLTEFMLEQGPSKNTNLQQWDKLWATNQKYVDAKAARYTAISKDRICTLVLNGNKYSSTPQIFQVPVHPKKTELGNRPQFRTNELYLEYEDANLLQKGEKITLMKWGNCIITDIQADGNALRLTADLAEEDTDFKSTKKINWLPKTDLLVEVDLVEFDHLINVDKVEEDMKFEDVLNAETRFSTKALADPNVKNLPKSTVIQFERRGYFIVDKIHAPTSESRTLELIYIPDGKTKAMSNLSTKVDIAKNVLGDAKDGEKKKKEKKEESKTEGKEKTETKPKEKKEKGETKEATKEAPKETKTEESKTEGVEITLADFAKIDIRIGKITECWKHPESEKLYCEKIDLGFEVREIGSGLQQFVTLEEMTTGLVCVLANLKTRKLANFPSTGMVLCASNNDHTAVELMRPDDGAKVGERVVLEGFDGVPQDKEKPIDPKKKVLETVLPHLKTDAEGYATFLGKKLKTSGGYIRAKTLKDAHIS